MGQEQMHSQPQEPERRQEEEVAEMPDTSAATEAGEKLKEEMDDLLEEIDGVLEENAEEFVNAYIQKGGE